MKLKAAWARVPEWGKAFLLAIALLATAHVFILRWVTVRSASMFATLLPGDLVGVERWPVWTGMDRGDIIVFRDPVEDDRPMAQRQLLVKRIAGLPGDEVELRNGMVVVNGHRMPGPEHATALWAVRLKVGETATGVLKELGLPPDFVTGGRTLIDLPLNEKLAGQLRKRGDVASVTRHEADGGTPAHIFPFSPNYRWNNDDYGPLRVPGKGDTVGITAFTLPLYDRIISRYEHNTVEVSGGDLLVNGREATRYVIKQDYYFVLGDSRDSSSDSRYWGFVPADHVVGRAGFVLLNARAVRGQTESRSFIAL
ncbi:MAG: signal peptidase I [Bacteroidetes bacterium]|nr:signal peptidase I [Bacteroidota bacterium]